MSHLAEAARRIFLNLPVVNRRTGTQHLTKHLNGRLQADYYPEFPRKWFRMYLGTVWDLTGKRERIAEKVAAARAKGKAPTKKGQGKRAQKRK